MSDETPAKSLIQDECEQLKDLAEALIRKLTSEVHKELSEAVYEAQDKVLDDLNRGLPPQDMKSRLLRHAKEPVARVLDKAGPIFAKQLRELSPGHDKIAALYARLGNELQHLSQSPDDRELQLSTEVLWQELRTLQEEEAAQIKNRYRKSLELPLGRAQEILDHAKQLKKKYGNPSATDSTAENSD